MFKFVSDYEVSDTLIYVDDCLQGVVSIWSESGYICYRRTDVDDQVQSCDVGFIVDHIEEFIKDGKFNDYDGSIFFILSLIVSHAIMECITEYVSPSYITTKDESYKKWIKSVQKDMIRWSKSK